MTKAELCALLAQRTGFPRQDVQYLVEAFCEVVQESLAEGHRIDLRGFGSFANKQRAPKLARNLATNTALQLPAHAVPSFKPAPAFVELIKARTLAT